MNHDDNQPAINPATGLPMLDQGWIDVAGNPYGANIYQPVWVPELPIYDHWEPSWDDC